MVQHKLPEPFLLLAKILRTQGDCAGARDYLKRYLARRTSALALEEMRESIRVIENCLAVTPGREIPPIGSVSLYDGHVLNSYY